MIKKGFFLFLAAALAACTASQPSADSSDPASKTFPYQPTWNVAHRGARSVAPENTLPAALKGYEFGADQWELDVAMTADGELVLLHDDDLKRTSNAREVFPGRRPWRVSDFTLAELRQLDFGSWFVKQDPFKQIADGAVSAAEQEALVNTPIPTLREALLLTQEHNWRVNVELKDLSGTPGDAQVAEKAVALIEELDMVDQVLISSFNHSYLTRVEQANPAVVTAALVDKRVRDPLKLLREIGADAYNPSYKKLGDFSIIRELREAGYQVYVWTVNDPDVMRQLIEAGASGIITDYPQVLAGVLKEYH